MYNDIVLGREETYDTAMVRCYDFCKSTDIKDGITLKLGNMINDFPFKVNGRWFKSSEILYLCGQFSNSDEQSIDVQKQLINSTSGFSAKKFVRNKYIELERKDFEEFRLQWMLWCVWQKTRGNREFQRLLLSLPDDAVIIENTSWQAGKTATIWGCKNMELRRLRQNVKQELANINGNMRKKDLDNYINIKTNKLSIGTFVGQNNLGKILMLCRQALKKNTEPNIDYSLLKGHDIYLLGQRLF